MKDMMEISSVIDILYTMKDDIRRKIFEIIFLSRTDGISFKSVVKEGKVPPTTAAYHLKKLTEAGMVEKSFKNLDDRRDYSFYHSTDLGDRAYFLIREIFSDLRIEEEEGEVGPLPDIMVIPLRYGPRCISVQKPR